MFETGERHCSSSAFQSSLPETGYAGDNMILSEVCAHCIFFPEIIHTLENRGQYLRSVTATYTANALYATQL